MNQNIENNPMHSSLAVAGISDLAKTCCLVGQITGNIRPSRNWSNPCPGPTPVAIRWPQKRKVCGHHTQRRESPFRVNRHWVKTTADQVMSGNPPIATGSCDATKNRDVP
jgi:hypothetical protein